MQCRARRIRDIFTWSSRLKYLFWQALGRRWLISLRLRRGPVVLVRAAPKTDFWVIAQVFFTTEYQIPFVLESEEVRRVLDLGSNVGYTLLYFAKEFPRATIIGYEPVAAHCRQAQEQLRLNRLIGRVDIRESAVGARAATAYISDRGSDSAITSEPDEGTTRIAIVDLFDEVAAGSIDLLKMDIEGGEYELVDDERFGQLKARYVVIEWHEWKSRPTQTKEWLIERLKGYGYWVEDMGTEQQVGDDLRVGILWSLLVR